MPHRQHSDCPSCQCWQPDDGETMVLKRFGVEIWRTGDHPPTSLQPLAPGEITIHFVSGSRPTRASRHPTEAAQRAAEATAAPDAPMETPERLRGAQSGAQQNGRAG